MVVVLSVLLSLTYLLLQVMSMAVTDNNELQIISRGGWFAIPPRQPITPLKLPVQYVVIAHTASKRCSTTSTCVSFIRNIQTYNMAYMRMWDIAYNFLVAGDGRAYEGRGWNYEGSHTKNYNNKSIGIAFIGDFTTALPPEKQIKVAQQLIERGVEEGYIAEDYKLVGAYQISRTLSPGTKLQENIKTWPHWTANP